MFNNENVNNIFKNKKKYLQSWSKPKDTFDGQKQNNQPSGVIFYLSIHTLKSVADTKVSVHMCENNKQRDCVTGAVLSVEHQLATSLEKGASTACKDVSLR